MNHWIVLPIVLPSLAAALLIIVGRCDRTLARVISIAGCAACLVVALYLTQFAARGVIEHYALGNWPAPYGIVLVLDRLSALMVLLNSALGLAVAIYAVYGWDARGSHFHALLQFQIMGVNGAFLTGDLFNLFVFFEVLLIASYGLMLHGGGAARFKAGMQYVAVNLTGSTLFLLAVALIYGTTGTLNMADLAVRVPQVPEADVALLRSGALLLLLVFAIKAALVPLHFWLPGTYANAPVPVAAFFAIMTKVGGYAIIRVATLIFGPDAGPLALVAAPWLVPAALVTLIVGFVGLLAARRLLPMMCFAVIGSMGTLLIAVGLFTEQASAAALYYIVHSTLNGAALFLLCELIAERRGTAGDRLVPAPAFTRTALLGGLFLLAGIGAVGLPPLSGFVGKLLILQSAHDTATGHPAAGIWAAILLTSALGLVAFARAGSQLFWRSAEVAPAGTPPVTEEAPAASVRVVIAATLVGGSVLLSAFAGPALGYFEATAAQLFETSDYIAAVLGERPSGTGR